MELKASQIKAKKLANNLYLVGWLFETHSSGTACMEKLAELYNAFDETENKKRDTHADGTT